MAETCCAGGNELMILACFRGSNVGQLSNQAAAELTQEGFGRMFHLAGIGGKLSGFVQSAKDIPLMMAIEGCQVGCVKAILENAQVPIKHYIVITDEGIEKNKNFNLQHAEIDHVKVAVKRVVSQSSPTEAVPSPAGCGCKSCR